MLRTALTIATTGALLCIAAQAAADDCDADECMTVTETVRKCPDGWICVTSRPSAREDECWRLLTNQYSLEPSNTHQDHRNRKPPSGGLDIPVVDGTPVYAMKNGVVNDTYDEWEVGNPSRRGNFVRIDHDDGTQGVFLHLQSVATGLKAGSAVAAGDLVGLSNSTGTRISGAHLHYSQWNEERTEQDDPQQVHPCR